MSEKLVKAQKKLNRADSLLKKSKYVFFAFLLLTAVVIGYQLYIIQRHQLISQRQADEQRDDATKEARERLNKALSENEKLHAVTQSYVKCVATVLLKPISERGVEDFESCSIPIRDMEAQTNVQSATPQRVLPVPKLTPPAQEIPTIREKAELPKPTEPTTSGGGDQPTSETPQQRSKATDVRACLLFNMICSKIEL